jgi:dTDP-4-amino-4,6-dideoxygalactose transaminase
MCLVRDQLKYAAEVTAQRLKLYQFYQEELLPLKQKGLLDFYVPTPEQRHNAHIFWIRLSSAGERELLRKHLLEKKVFATFHYLALHRSPYGKRFAGTHPLVNAEKFEDELLRIPLYYPMPLSDAEKVVLAVRGFFEG